MDLEKRRRLAHIIGGFFSVPAIMLLWLGYGSSDSFIYYAYPLLALYLLVSLLLFVKQVVNWLTLETATFTVGGLTLLLHLSFLLFAPATLSPGWDNMDTKVFMALGILVLVGHSFFSTPKALVASAALVLSSTLLMLAHALTSALAGAGYEPLRQALTLELYLMLTGVFAQLLSRSKEDYANERQKVTHMQSLAFHDGLTGIANRRRLEEELAKQLSLAERHHRPFSVIFFDIDDFKRINDQHGHYAGDLVLKTVANLATSTLRAGDLVGRWGGEEFMIITPETYQKQAEVLAERLRRRIARNSQPAGLRVTASFGVQAWRPGMDMQALLLKVDALLYQAKRAGKNLVVGEYDPPEMVLAGLKLEV